ncbi:MAG: class II aldolase/adducin family protein [Clostridiales Family XIII bacterium]|jgi:rhamnose utilization protein RhaD (predicted bifunctional aldolase and dehydrogenase)|nr:class II aldolase/adducin family protein [Clostridiales Family XIII bacterium]
MIKLDNLIAMSRKYGADEDYVLEGGGNTSFKEGGVMAVKASGGSLGVIDAGGFVLMDVAKLRAMTGADYPEADDEREALAIKDMMAARLPGQGDKRPSVECILHALFTKSYVLHVHPALINGLTCSVEGAAAAAELFGDREDSLLWVPLTKPGFILSKACADAFETHKAKHGAYPDILLLQNHGIFVAGDSTDRIDGIMADIVGRVKSRIKREPDLAESGRMAPSFIADALTSAYGEGGAAYAHFQSSAEIARMVASKDAAGPLMDPFTPDHIVYDKAYPLWITEETASGAGAPDIAPDIAAAFRAFTDAHGFKPKVALIEGHGAFTLGDSAHEADAAAALLTDAVKIAVYSEAFGGPLALPEDFTNFIANWEIESYRQKKAFT